MSLPRDLVLAFLAVEQKLESWSIAQADELTEERNENVIDIQNAICDLLTDSDLVDQAWLARQCNWNCLEGYRHNGKAN